MANENSEEVSAASTSARDQFDRQASHYNTRWASWSDETLRQMVALADPQPDWRVLDVATGSGFTAMALAPLVAEVIGADISPGMLAQAAKQAAERGIENVQWVEAPAEALPFPDEAFDLVTCRIAPHHFASIPQFLTESFRTLKLGGVLVIGDTAVPDEKPDAAAWQNRVEKERDTSHVRNLSPSEWRTAAETAGFIVTQADYLPGAIPIPLTAWLETSGTTGERADQVRQWFAEAPESARQEFQIATAPATGEVTFAWARVILRGERRNGVQ
ncbi:MAG: class I SAM-dependent methyltransferase [Armatimonadaceae bacterium]